MVFFFFQKPVSELVPPDTNLSTREMNRARRKARQQRTQNTTEEISSQTDEPDKKRFKIEMPIKNEEHLSNCKNIF